MAALLAEDPNLRIVLKEFPILSNESIDAARIAVLVGNADVDYWTFHETLFTSRSQVDKQVALAAASDLGLSPVALELDMGTGPWPRPSDLVRDRAGTQYHRNADLYHRQ